jgi:hypothetical protein
MGIKANNSNDKAHLPRRPNNSIRRRALWRSHDFESAATRLAGSGDSTRKKSRCSFKCFPQARNLHHCERPSPRHVSSEGTRAFGADRRARHHADSCDNQPLGAGDDSGTTGRIPGQCPQLSIRYAIIKHRLVGRDSKTWSRAPVIPVDLTICAGGYPATIGRVFLKARPNKNAAQECSPARRVICLERSPR